jgi:gas vesicle protein
MKTETEEISRSVSEVRNAIEEQVKTGEEQRQDNSRPDLEAEAEPLP